MLEKDPRDEFLPDSKADAAETGSAAQGARGESSTQETTLEKNLTLLLQNAYHPVEPSELFRARLRRTLHERQQRLVSRRRSVVRSVVAASILFVAVLLASQVSWQSLPVTITPNSGLCEIDTGEGWQPLLAPRILSGARLRTGADGRVLASSQQLSELYLEPNSELHITRSSFTSSENSHSLLRGGCRWHVESGTQRSLNTPVARIHASGCEIGIFLHDVAFAEPHGSAPILKGNQMNAKVITGAAVGALLVTLIIYNMQDDGSVTVDTGSQKHTVTEGSATFDESGELSTHSSSNAASSQRGADNATTSSSESTQSDSPFVMQQIAGRVETAEGTTIASAQVLFRDEIEGVETIVARAETDDEGAFSLSVREGQSGEIEVKKERFDTTLLSWPVEESSQGEDGEAEAQSPVDTQEEHAGEASDAPAEAVVLLLERETAIRGTIAFATTEESPPKEYFVAIERYYDAYRRDQPIMRQFKNEDRSFYFAVKPGQYRVWAYARGYYRSAEVRVAPVAHEVAELNFSLELGTSVSGRITATDDGKAIADAVVFLPLEHVPGSINRMLRNDVDERIANVDRSNFKGEFQLDDLSPGQHTLRVLHPDYNPVDVRVDLVAGETDLEIKLVKGTSIRGTVLDARGNPIPGSVVLAFTMVLNQDLGNQNLTFCKEDGSYEIRNLNPGPYILVLVEDPDTSAGQADAKIEMVQVRANKDTIKDFVAIPQDAVLRGSVRDMEGNIVSACQVTLTHISDDDEEFTFKTGNTNADGEFEIVNIVPGRYLVGISNGSGGNFTIVDEVNLTEAIDYDRDFTLTRLKVAGTLRSNTQEPIANGEVLIFKLKPDSENKNASGEQDMDGREFAGRSLTDAEGAFSFDTLGEGRFALLVTANGYQHVWSETFKLDEKLLPDHSIDLVAQPGGQVVVTVRDANGEPAAGIDVRVLDDQGRFVNQGLPPRTDGSGYYSFARLSKGKYTVEVRRGKEEAISRTFNCIDLTQPQRLEIALPPLPETD